MLIYNNNPGFGDCGPFEAKSFEALADEMASTFAEWAHDEWVQFVSDGPSVEFVPECPKYEASAADRMRGEFITGLTRVLTCEVCGQEYHADAPERGHADDCQARWCDAPIGPARRPV